MPKDNLMTYATTGVKALAGGFIAWIASYLIFLFFGLLAGESGIFANGILAFFFIIFILGINVLLLGYVYNKLWGWK